MLSIPSEKDRSSSSCLYPSWSRLQYCCNINYIKTSESCIFKKQLIWSPPNRKWATWRFVLLNHQYRGRLCAAVGWWWWGCLYIFKLYVSVNKFNIIILKIFVQQHTHCCVWPYAGLVTQRFKIFYRFTQISR